VWGAVVAHSSQPLADESAYLRRSIAFNQIFQNFEAGEPIDSAAEWQAYGGGRWPPLLPMLLGAGIYVSGFNEIDAQITIARLLIVIISALSTGVVYLLTKKLLDAQSAIASAFIHIFSLEALVYSHRLMSEVPYGFLILVVFYALVSFWKASKLYYHIGWIIVCGIALGLAGLVRASALTFLIAIPLLVIWYRAISFRFIYAICLGLISLIVLMPWLSYLSEKEGEFVLLATSGGTNLGLFNNTLFNINYIYHDEPRLLKEAANDYLQEYAEANSLSESDAGYAIGINTIFTEPILTAQRLIDRTLHHISYDYNMMVMFMRLGYPPTSDIVVLLANFLQLVSHVLIVWLMLTGVVSTWDSFEYRYGWLIVAIFTLMLSITSVSVPRFHHVTMLIYLPFAGYAIYHKLNRFALFRPSVIVGTLIVIFASVTLFLPGMRSQRPTTYYSELINGIDAILGNRTRMIDEFIFSTSSNDIDSVSIQLLSDGYQFESGEEVVLWKPDEQTAINLVVNAYSPTEPLTFEIVTIIDDKIDTQILIPVQPQAWRSWMPSGVENIDYQWNSDR